MLMLAGIILDLLLLWLLLELLNKTGEYMVKMHMWS